jgi:TonB family protein
MLQPSMPMSELPPDDSPPDLAHTLEEHLLAGFPPDLALDLVLNELVARAAAATAAGGAALALPRGDTMVCRATTGELAPGLGLTLNPADGLSGASLRTRQPQISVDTEADPRVDLTAARRLGIRSILVVPVFRWNDEDMRPGSVDSQEDTPRHQIVRSNGNEDDRDTELMGIIEVFSATPHAFSDSHQTLLQGFAAECARVRVVATELGWHKPVASVSDDFMPPPLQQPNFGPADFSLSWPHDPAAPTSEGPASTAPESVPVARDVVAAGGVAPEPVPATAKQQHPISIVSPLVRRPSYEGLSLVLAALVIVAAIGISFLIGSRIGWFRQASQVASSHSASVSPADTQPCTRPDDLTCLAGGRSTVSWPAEQAHSSSERKSERKSAGNAPRTLDKTRARGAEKAKDKSATPAAAPGELVVYEKGKVVFRMKPAPATAASATEAAKGRYQGSTPASETNGQDKNAVVEASSTARIAPSQNVWLSPQEAERRLLNRTEPKFPAEALAAHRVGASNVVLEILVADDGSVSNIHTISGDPALASAAADAVRKWRYQPYRVHNSPTQFQTDVSVRFAAPNQIR